MVWLQLSDDWINTEHVAGVIKTSEGYRVQLTGGLQHLFKSGDARPLLEHIQNESLNARLAAAAGETA